MANIKATIKKPVHQIQAKAVSLTTSSVRLSDLADIDTTVLEDGAILIYDEATKKFSLKSEIQSANTKIIGGSF